MFFLPQGKKLSFVGVCSYLYIFVFLLSWASALQLPNPSMCQYGDLCTLCAIIIAAVCGLGGLTTNLFIAVFSCRNWMRSHRIVSSDKILFSLGTTRFLMMGLFVVNIFCLFTSPALLSPVHISTFFLGCWMFLESCSLWFVTLLNTLYYVKISNFQHSAFLLLKQNLSQKISGLLWVCVLISAFTSLPYVVFRLTSSSPVSLVVKNGTKFYLKEDMYYFLTSYTLGSSLQFITNVMLASLLIHSLRRHIQKMQRNATSFWSPQTEAHVGAMKLMIYFLVFYIPYSVVTLILYLPTSSHITLAIRLICVTITTLYHPGHSVFIILTHPKLKTKAKQILCFNK